MKRYLKIILIAAICIIPAAIGATSLTVGINTWYVKWEPYWGKNSFFPISLVGLTGKPPFGKMNKRDDITPSIMYGPYLSLNLPKHFRITSGFLYGYYTGHGEGRGSILLAGGMLARDRLSIKRFDSDSSIGYSFTSFFQLNIGFKYTYYDYHNTLSTGLFSAFSSNIYRTKISKEYNEYSPALGIHFLIPLIDKKLYLLIGTSVIFNFVYFKGFTRELGTAPIPYQVFNGNFNKLGSNSVLSFAYYIEEINMTISAGFRYQFFKLLSTDSSETVSLQKFLWDHFYGATFSVMYTIDFSRKNNKTSDSSEPGKV